MSNGVKIIIALALALVVLTGIGINRFVTQNKAKRINGNYEVMVSTLKEAYSNSYDNSSLNEIELTCFKGRDDFLGSGEPGSCQRKFSYYPKGPSFSESDYTLYNRDLDEKTRAYARALIAKGWYKLEGTSSTPVDFRNADSYGYAVQVGDRPANIGGGGCMVTISSSKESDRLIGQASVEAYCAY